MGIIYLATNIITGLSYIGQTKNSLKQRWKGHFYSRNRGGAFKEAIRDYGIDNFRLEILEETDNLDERETYWIEQFGTYENGYNNTPDGKYRYGHNIYNERELLRRQAKARRTRQQKLEERLQQSKVYYKIVEEKIQVIEEPKKFCMTIEQFEQEVLAKEMENFKRECRKEKKVI